MSEYKVDRKDLVGEWEQFPQDYHDALCDLPSVTKEVDDLQREVDKAQKFYRRMRAKMILQVKKDFHLFGFDKMPSDPVAKATAEVSDTFTEAVEAYFDLREQLAEANERKNELWMVRAAMDNKKDAITGLQRFQLAGYYSTSTPSPDEARRAARVRDKELANKRAASDAASNPKRLKKRTSLTKR